MTPLFLKMNLKDHKRMVVLNAPPSFEREIEALQGVTVSRSMGTAQEVAFLLAFVTKQKEVSDASRAIAKLSGDPTVWFAYPKQSSKRYACEFNRDTGWKEVGTAGYEPVRMVAIDDDWSALRFRRASHIRVMKRDPRSALSREGRKKAAKRT